MRFPIPKEKMRRTDLRKNILLIESSKQREFKFSENVGFQQQSRVVSKFCSAELIIRPSIVKYYRTCFAVQ